MENPTLASNSGENKKNIPSLISLIIGVISIALLAFNYRSGLLSAFGVVGAGAGLVALFAGFRGLKAANELAGQGRTIAYLGMGLGGVGALAFVIMIAFSAQRGIKMAGGGKQIETTTFQGDGFSLEYPDTWEEIDLSQPALCNQEGIDCVLALAHPSQDSSNINLIRYELRQTAPLSELDAFFWDSYAKSASDLNLELEKEIEVAGVPAMKRIFNIPSQQADNGRGHLLQVGFVKDLWYYQFTGWAPGPDALQDHQQEFEDIIFSLQFAP